MSAAVILQPCLACWLLWITNQFLIDCSLHCSYQERELILKHYSFHLWNLKN